VDNLEMARNTVEPWRSLGVAGVDESIIDAWFGVGRKDEAISYARSLKEGTLRTPCKQPQSLRPQRTKIGRHATIATA